MGMVRVWQYIQLVIALPLGIIGILLISLLLGEALVKFMNRRHPYGW